MYSIHGMANVSCLVSTIQFSNSYRNMSKYLKYFQEDITNFFNAQKVHMQGLCLKKPSDFLLSKKNSPKIQCYNHFSLTDAY